MIDNAIISVFDKDNLGYLVKNLKELNSDIRIISSGGTAEKIKELGFDVEEVSDYTGFPEAPGGLVKTLHPKVHGGILLDPERETEEDYMEENDVLGINLVVVNLYPFEGTLESGKPEEEIVENIDIGGPTLIRSAAKGALRHGNVVPIVQPQDYGRLIQRLKEKNGDLNDEFVMELVEKAFSHTKTYDKKINNWTEDLIEES